MTKNCSAMIEYASLVEEEKIQKTMDFFHCPREAAEEIKRLQELNLEMIIKEIVSDPPKRPRGRPRKERPLSKKGGRPIKHTKEEMEKIIERYESLKGRLKKPCTDKKLLELIVNIRDDTKKRRTDKKEALTKRLQKELKYFRDKTGIRQGPKKRKTP